MTSLEKFMATLLFIVIAGTIGLSISSNREREAEAVEYEKQCLRVSPEYHCKAMASLIRRN